MSSKPSAAEVRSIVREVLAELERAPVTSAPGAPVTAPTPVPKANTAPAATTRPAGSGDVTIDVHDPTVEEERRRIGVDDPVNASGLANLASATYARLAVGRAGPRPRTRTMLLFNADHAVTQDAIFGEVPTEVLDQLGLFTVQTRVSDQDEYLLRPDLGRQLSDEARAEIDQRCTKSPQVQIVVGDGLSAAAVTNNLPQVYPVLEQGLSSAGLTLGTPFFVRYCRVGVMNAVNDVIGADVVVLLIGERPGLGVADALSVYSGWRPGPGKSDAHRDVICMITANGGTNPLEAGAFVVEHVKQVVAAEASGVELRLKQSGDR